ncbi:hydrogenase maturation protease [bacterium]|nr:hydrogenase maturation protease [bacterium]
MNREPVDLLVIGYGNPGRLDDGLGPALAEAIEQLELPGVTVEANYQLTVEDAAQVAEHRTVLFADADVGGPEPFWVKRIDPAGGHLSFSTHSIDPRSVLALARQLFAADTDAYLMGIRGYEFNEFGERLSPRAQDNLAAATAYVEAAARNAVFTEIRPEGEEWSAQAQEPPE